MQPLPAVVQSTTPEPVAIEEPEQRKLSQQLVSAALVGAVLVLALVSRWPYLVQIPELTDETIEIGRGLTISRGERFPLTNWVAFTGPIFHYALAAVFKLFGPSLLAARGLVMVLGCLTVLITYALARTIAGRPVALLAAGFMATSSVHTLASSHLAWSHSTTPFFVTLTLWQLARAVRQGSRPGLLLTAFLLGLALQSHPTVFLLVPALIGYLAWKGRHLLHVRLVAAMFGLLTVSYSNMLVYNVAHGLGSLWEASQKEADYLQKLPAESRGYPGRAREVFSTLVRLPSSQLDQVDAASEQPLETLTVIYAGLTLGGLALLVARAQPLPALGVLALVLLLPLSSAEHALLPRQGRYLAPVLPLLYIGLSACLWAAFDLARRSGRRWIIPVVLAMGAFMLVPLERTSSYYHESELAGRTNQRYFDALAVLRARRYQGETVFLDSRLDQERTGAGGHALLSLQTLAALEGLPVAMFQENRVARQLSQDLREVSLLSRSNAEELQRRLSGSGITAELLESQIAQTPYRLYRLRSSTSADNSSRLNP